MPKTQEFEEHSPTMIGASMYFVNRKEDGKTLITSPVTELSLCHENIWEIKTVNSVYLLRKL
jgi:hypothetical protein